MESNLMSLSEDLKQKRHEKVKLKGLGDYQKQIESCISEQRQVHELLAAAQILRK